MAFKIHDVVRIKKLNKTGEVVEVLKADLYRVAVGTLLMSCKESELSPSQKATSKHADLRPPSQSNVISEKRTARSLERIDLHGMTVADAMHAFEDHLNKALIAGMDSFAVVHGHGTGRIHQALLNYLKSASVVRSFRVDDFNSGITHIYL
ncbi:MAG: Smr/MutS family protein [Deltaproteobacteria bacterium]|nr:Smr/MutS family protein [Deltaproteobacteria bacterium]